MPIVTLARDSHSEAVSLLDARCRGVPSGAPRRACYARAMLRRSIGVIGCGLIVAACSSGGDAGGGSGGAAGAPQNLGGSSGSPGRGGSSNGNATSGGSSNGGSPGRGGSSNGNAGDATSGGKTSSSGGAPSTGGRNASGGAATAGIGGVLQPGNPGAADVTFDINADKDAHPISPLIYGVNADCTDRNARPTLCRLGGNRWTAYNWENNASNAGRDYCYQNDSFISESNTPGKGVMDAVAQASGAGAATLVTIPVVDYVAADKMSGDSSCSGDVRKSGSDYLSTRFKKNQPRSGGTLSMTPDATDGVVSQDEFVNFLKNSAGSSRILISLDNEPDLWSYTHEEVHPDPLTYAELVKRNMDYAKAVRAVWPEVAITGFVSYGFGGYLNLQDAPDAGNNGEFIDYYLAQMQAAEAAAGARLVDYLDLHWYPEAQGGSTRITDAGSSNDLVAARVQAPRSLWDGTYTEKSWIVDVTGGPIKLIPWLKTKIAKNYPGTKLAFTEWNYGGGGHISGAIATADVLGIFGREGVELAAMWPLNKNESFTLAAFQMYRNFDGQGAAFGDVSIAATSSDNAKASVYASYDASDPSRTVIVAINRSGGALKAGIKLAHSTSYGSAKVYVLSGTSNKPSAGPNLSAVATNAFNYEMPAYSVSVLVPAP